MEAYRSGHNGADLKSVVPASTWYGGSNPPASADSKDLPSRGESVFTKDLKYAGVVQG